MKRRLMRLGLVGLGLVAIAAAGASPAAAKTKTATFNMCVPTFVPILDPTMAPTGDTNNAFAASIPVTVPKIRGKLQDGRVTAFSTAGVQINHTFVGDIELFLVSPGGKGAVLSTDNGGNDDGFGTGGCAGPLLFGDLFTTSIAGAGNPAGETPITGAFKPESPLSTFVGGPARGNWTFFGYDDSTTDTGAIAAVALNFTYTYNAPNKKKGKKK